MGKSALEVINPYFLTSLRYSLSAVALLIILLALESRKKILNDVWSWRMWGFGLLAVPGGVLLTFVGLSQTVPEHAAIIAGSQPILAMLIRWGILSQKPSPHQLCAILLALLGVFLVVTRGDLKSFSTSTYWFGDALVLGASVCWVLYTLGGSKYPHWTSLRYTTLTSICGAISMFALSTTLTEMGLITSPSFGEVTQVGWQVVYITIGVAILATLSWHSGIKRVGPDGVIFINFVPVTGLLIGFWRGYDFTSAEIFGALFIILALLLNQLPTLLRIVTRVNRET